MSLGRAIRSRLERRLSPAQANFWCHATEGALIIFGLELVGRQVLPAMAIRLGASNLVLGILGSMQSYLFFLPLLFASRLEAVRDKKRLVLRLGLGKRLPTLLILLAVPLLAEHHPYLCLTAIGAALAVAAGFDALSAPAWIDLLAETVTAGRAGRLFGIRNFIISALRLSSAAICGAVLARIAFPHNYLVLYASSFVAGMLSLGIFSMVDEMPADLPPKPPQAPRHYLAELVRSIRQDHSYRNYLIFQAIDKGHVEIVMFYVVAGLKVHGVPDARVVSTSIALLAVTGMVGNATLPFLAERIGPRRVLAASVVARAAAAVWAALSPSWAMFLWVFVIDGLGRSANGVSDMPFMMSLYPRAKRVGYMTLASVAVMPSRMIAAPLAGLVIYLAGFRVMFAIAAAALLLALVPLMRCRPAEPDSPADAVTAT